MMVRWLEGGRDGMAINGCGWMDGMYIWSLGGGMGW
jgi:hypothetical protein